MFSRFMSRLGVHRHPNEDAAYLTSVSATIPISSAGQNPVAQIRSNQVSPPTSIPIPFKLNPSNPLRIRVHEPLANSISHLAVTPGQELKMQEMSEWMKTDFTGREVVTQYCNKHGLRYDDYFVAFAQCEADKVPAPCLIAKTNLRGVSYKVTFDTGVLSGFIDDGNRT